MNAIASLPHCRRALLTLALLVLALPVHAALTIRITQGIEGAPPTFSGFYAAIYIDEWHPVRRR